MNTLDWKRRLLALLCGALQLAACAEIRGATPDAGEPSLPDHTAGKACKSDSDCAGGRCSHGLHLFAANQAEPTPDGYCTLECARDSQCGASGECSVPSGAKLGECLATCDKSSACRAGYWCVGESSLAVLHVRGTCQPQPATGKLSDGRVGESCSTDDDCPGGQCAATSQIGTAFPGNYCTARCLDDEACGAGGACLVFVGSGEAGYCYKPCFSDAECTRDHYRCVNIGPNFDACYPAPTPLPDHSAGQPCSSDSDCGGAQGSCVSELPAFAFNGDGTSPTPGGYCTQVCSRDEECGADGQCIWQGTTGGLCMGVCTAATGCRDGYRCWQHGRDLNDESVCVPASP